MAASAPRVYLWECRELRRGCKLPLWLSCIALCLPNEPDRWTDLAGKNRKDLKNPGKSNMVVCKLLMYHGCQLDRASFFDTERCNCSRWFALLSFSLPFPGCPGRLWEKQAEVEFDQIVISKFGLPRKKINALAGIFNNIATQTTVTLVPYKIQHRHQHQALPAITGLKVVSTESLLPLHYECRTLFK